MRPLPTPTPDTPSLEELRAAIGRLDPGQRPRWGRMDAAQMLRHCRAFAELCLGRVPIAWPVRMAARVLGPLFLRRLLRRSPLEAPRNLATLAPLRADPQRVLDLAAERQALLAALDEVAAVQDGRRHPLYGAMRAVDIRSLVRHHTAHHMNQFDLLVAAGSS